MNRVRDLHKAWMKDPAYQAEYEALEDEFHLTAAIIGARGKAGLTQDELASRMDTTRSVIARLESGRALPSGRMLKRLADATGTRLRIRFERSPGGAYAR